MADKASILVVANRTAESEELRSALQARAQEGPAEFTLLVPATPHGLKWAGNMHAGGEEAWEHLMGMVERMRGGGLEIKEAKIGDPDALAATVDETGAASYDEIVISTLPLHVSKWLKLDLPHKAEHATGLPVTHVVASDAE